MLAVVVGSAFDSWPDLEVVRTRRANTEWGEPSGVVQQGRLCSRELLVLRRHGDGGRLLPHDINYRANIAALKALGATQVVSLNVVGGIAAQMSPGALLVPDQLIDYTWGRAHTFADPDVGMRGHVDFTEPYCAVLRERLLRAGRLADVDLIDGAVYGVTQGPRLETRAEVARCARDGVDVVGMTGMPEAALAREAGLGYVSLCSVVNWAAGISSELITLSAIEHVMRTQAALIQRCLRYLSSI